MLNEQDKYTQAWKSGSENNSRTAVYLIPYLQRKINPAWKVLDLGCGNGLVTETLRQNGINNIYGADITLEGLNLNKPINKFGSQVNGIIPKKEYYVESPLWKLPFEDKSFDYTYSTDVIEHIAPEMIESVIKEIYRITRIATFHCIATFADTRGGIEFHLTVQPIEKWIQQFTALNVQNINTEIIDRTNYLRNTIPNYNGL